MARVYSRVYWPRVSVARVYRESIESLLARVYRESTGLESIIESTGLESLWPESIESL